jgi:hypothetical protein
MDDNLRRGNNNEGLGIQLLRGVGAVAPVPRDQDVGIDAVVTLLKRDEGRRLLAGSSVFVQLKSSSIRKLVFDHSDLEWLQRLELPYFIGSVDSDTASLSLYTVHGLNMLLGSDPPLAGAELCLDLESGCVNSPMDTKEEFDEWLALDAKSLTPKIYLGPPVLRWTLSAANDRDFLDRSHPVLESWVAVAEDNRVLQSCGETLTASWETGALPTGTGSVGLYQPNDGTGRSAVRLLNIALKRVAMEASFDGDLPAIESLLDAASHFKKYGVDDRDIVAAGVVAKLRNKPK